MGFGHYEEKNGDHDGAAGEYQKKEEIVFWNHRQDLESL